MSDRSSPSADQIHQVLRGLRCAGIKTDPLQAGIIGRVAACDGYVRVQVDPEAIPATDRGEVRQNIEAMISVLPGIKQVTVEWVEGEDDAPADRPASHPSPQAQGHPHGHHHGHDHAHGHDHGHAQSHAGHAQAAGPMEQSALTGVKHIIAVGAGKGGVGKSTVSVLLAVGLARRGLRVGLMDADVYGPSIPKMLGVESAKPAVQHEQIVPIVACDLKIMSIGFMIPPDQAVIWRGPMIHGTIKQFLDNVAWDELDYLIVDLPPGTGDVPLTLSQSIPLTGAVVVCTPQDVALLDAMRAARMYQQLNVDVLGVVENMSYFVAPDTGKEYDLFGRGGAERAAGELGVPFLGAIPINIAIRVSGDAGTPQDVFASNPQGVTDAVEAMINNLEYFVQLKNRAAPRAVGLNITS